MEATVRQLGEVSVVDLSGNITTGHGDTALREKVFELVEDGRRNILLNLEQVSYMDSCGIGELVACYKRVAERRGAVKLLKPSAKVSYVLQVTKLAQFFETFGDESEAVVSFSAEGRAVAAG